MLLIKIGLRPNLNDACHLITNKSPQIIPKKLHSLLWMNALNIKFYFARAVIFLFYERCPRNALKTFMSQSLWKQNERIICRNFKTFGTSNIVYSCLLRPVKHFLKPVSLWTFESNPKFYLELFIVWMHQNAYIINVLFTLFTVTNIIAPIRNWSTKIQLK